MKVDSWPESEELGGCFIKAGSMRVPVDMMSKMIDVVFI